RFVKIYQFSWFLVHRAGFLGVGGEGDTAHRRTTFPLWVVLSPGFVPSLLSSCSVSDSLKSLSLNSVQYFVIDFRQLGQKWLLFYY
ncbi:hypothetical protein L195_g027292, partial [Trifolium pratense]